jgi:hypothetical protein
VEPSFRIVEKRFQRSEERSLFAFIREKSRKGGWAIARPHVSGRQWERGQWEKEGARGYEGSTTEFKIVLKHERVRNFLF